VITFFAWTIVGVTGERRALAGISRRSVVFLVLSGVATGVSWLAYFRALQLGQASRVSPIDKLSLPLTIVLAAVFLGESVGWKLGVGVTLMTIGAVLADQLSRRSHGGLEDHRRPSTVVLETSRDRLYQDGYIFVVNFTQHAQNVARFCAIFPISHQP
jgi:uncharacterized membrane protein